MKKAERNGERKNELKKAIKQAWMKEGNEKELTNLDPNNAKENSSSSLWGFYSKKTIFS